MTAGEDRLEALINRLDDKLTKQIHDLTEKVDSASDFQTSFQGVARTLMWVVIVVGAITTTYAALHGVFTPGGK